MTFRSIGYPNFWVIFAFACFVSHLDTSFTWAKPQQEPSSLLDIVESKGVPRRLWKFSESVKKELSPKVISESAERARKLNQNQKANSQQLTRLMSFWQMAYFHDFYHKLYDAKMKTKLGNTMKLIANPPDFFRSGQDGKRLRNQWGTTIDSLGTLNMCPQTYLKNLETF